MLVFYECCQLRDKHSFSNVIEQCCINITHIICCIFKTIIDVLVSFIFTMYSSNVVLSLSLLMCHCGCHSR